MFAIPKCRQNYLQKKSRGLFFLIIFLSLKGAFWLAFHNQIVEGIAHVISVRHTVSGLIFNTVLHIRDVLCLMQPAYDYYDPACLQQLNKLHIK